MDRRLGLWGTGLKRKNTEHEGGGKIGRRKSRDNRYNVDKKKTPAVRRRRRKKRATQPSGTISTEGGDGQHEYRWSEEKKNQTDQPVRKAIEEL